MSDGLSFGKRIKLLRKKHNCIQDDLSQVCSVSKATVSLWESDDITPKTMHALQLADFFQVTVRYLVTGVDLGPVAKSEFNPQETRLVSKYNEAPDNIKKAIKAMLNF